MAELTHIEDGKAAVFKREGTFHARFRIEGKYVYRSLKTGDFETAKKAAQKLLHQLEFSVEKGLPIHDRTFGTVIDEYVRFRKKETEAERTSENMLRQIERVVRFWKEYAGSRSISAVGDPELEDYVQWRRDYYAEMNHAPLKVAIYFSRINKWILLSPESFFEDGRRVYIDLPHGMARNELSMLGDRTIATLPPLSIEFTGDPDDERAIVKPDGTVIFTIRQVHMKCAGKIITQEEEKRIAFYLMRYGRWSETGAPATLVDGRLMSFAFVSAPDEKPLDDQPFHMLGDLSSMVSSAFRELTVGDDGVFSLDVKFDPAFFELKIPEGYKGDALPLWQFVIQPNPEFRYDP